VITVDVDSWSSLLRFYSVPHDLYMAESMVDDEQGLDLLVDLFEEYNVKATFFTPGEMVLRHQSKIREIAKAGHEVANHGFLHEKDECLLVKSEQKKLVEKTSELIENATGVRPFGFRAPCLRVSGPTLEVLNELGYLYDSSYLPMYVPGDYGSLSFERKPYYPMKPHSRFLEIPVSTNPVGLLPFSGSWLRNLGASWAKVSSKILFDIGCPAMLYVHPRDVLELPHIKGVPWHVYRNTGRRCLKILEQVIEFVQRQKGRSLRAVDLAREELATARIEDEN
jgi:peptidoglycan/xylan/chitin deacetylase (PgdA/CDA1 family)